MVLLRPDIHVVNKISERSYSSYKKGLRPFIEWLDKNATDPFFEELDDLLIEFKN